MASDLRLSPSPSVFVVEKQSLRVGFVRPAKSLLDVCSAFLSQSDARLVVPRRILETAVLVHRFIHYIPCEHLTGVVFHHRRDVLLQQVGRLCGREMALREPFGIVVIPDQTVSANFHAVSLREADDFIALRESRRCLGSAAPSTTSLRPRLDHIEFACQSGRIGGFGKHGRANCRTHQQVGLVGCLPQVAAKAQLGSRDQKQDQDSKWVNMFLAWFAPMSSGIEGFVPIN
jgi:hypothetical protein